MWKRDQTPKPESGSQTTTPDAASTQPTPAAVVTPASQLNSRSGTSSIGPSVVIKGELSGTEDLTIEGKVEGTVDLQSNKLTVGPDGRVQANISAKTVVVLGQVTGDITAIERISIQEDGSVDGDLAAPSIAIADGAHFRGSVQMQRKAAGQGTPSSKAVASA